MTLEQVDMDVATFERFRSLIYEHSGISLGPGKKALLVSRLGRRMRELGITTYRAYLEYVLRDGAGDEVVELLDAVSTNVTSFFREPNHFQFLAREFRRATGGRGGRFRVWCAAASSGEEAYSLAMTLRESVAAPSPDVKILATDLSTRVLTMCREGVYGADKLKTVPPAMRARYFTAEERAGRSAYRVNDSLRSMIRFARLNLATPPFPLRGPLDAIFCRNVMIYFDPRVKRALLSEMYRLLRPGGHLVVGHAESLGGLGLPFDLVEPAVYVRA